MTASLHNPVLDTIFRRRAVRNLDPIEISPDAREQILRAAIAAPSSLNRQPYRIYWIEPSAIRQQVAALCPGQRAAATASVLVIMVADTSCWSTAPQLKIEWMRQTGWDEQRLLAYQKKAKRLNLLFIQDWFGIVGWLRWLALRLFRIFKPGAVAPSTRAEFMKWAIKSAALASENLMIACESLEIKTCPMEGFDPRRLARLLRLSSRTDEIVMVIALGAESRDTQKDPQWRKRLDQVVVQL